MAKDTGKGTPRKPPSGGPAAKKAPAKTSQHELNRAVAEARKAAKEAQAAAQVAQRAAAAAQGRAVPRASAAATGEENWVYATVQGVGGPSVQIQLAGAEPSLASFLLDGGRTTAVRIEVDFGQETIDAQGVVSVQAALAVFLVAFQGRAIRVASCQSTDED